MKQVFQVWAVGRNVENGKRLVETFRDMRDARVYADMRQRVEQRNGTTYSIMAKYLSA